MDEKLREYKQEEKQTKPRHNKTQQEFGLVKPQAVQ